MVYTKVRLVCFIPETVLIYINVICQLYLDKNVFQIENKNYAEVTGQIKAYILSPY